MSVNRTIDNCNTPSQYPYQVFSWVMAVEFILGLPLNLSVLYIFIFRYDTEPSGPTVMRPWAKGPESWTSFLEMLFSLMEVGGGCCQGSSCVNAAVSGVCVFWLQEQQISAESQRLPVWIVVSVYR